MSRINIPQYSEGLMIAAARTGFQVKANIFQSVVVEARIVRACPVPNPAAEAISVAIAERRKLLAPNVNRTWSGILSD
jgi:hypothetical protein